MKKRIMHVLNTSSYSGAENVAITIINEMNKEYECCYVSLDGNIRGVLEENNIKFIPIEKLNIFEISRVVRNFKPDIIHAHDFTASIICSFLGVRKCVISHLHNNSPWIKTYHPYSFLYLISTLGYKKILGVSKSIFSEYVFGRTINKKSIIVSNPINVNEIIVKSQSNNKAEYDIVFLGRLSEEKNPLKFIDIIRECVFHFPNLRVAMIGDGDLKNKCEKKICELGLVKNIDLLGFIRNPYCILATTKILCMTSQWEGFGLVAIEALVLGIPVIATPVGGLVDIVNDKCGLLTDNEKKYVDEVKHLLKDKEYWSEKSLSAIKRSYDFNNIQNYIKKLDEIYFG